MHLPPVLLKETTNKTSRRRTRRAPPPRARSHTQKAPGQGGLLVAAVRKGRVKADWGCAEICEDRMDKLDEGRVVRDLGDPVGQLALELVEHEFNRAVA